jgi:hypothetical protein
LNTKLSLEEFFDKIYVPFDSEFLVAKSSSRSRSKSQKVTLTEVFNVHSTQPLQKFRIGAWSSGTGLTWFMAPFVQRRRHLHGIVIKGAVRPQVFYIEELSNSFIENTSVYTAWVSNGRIIR